MTETEEQMLSKKVDDLAVKVDALTASNQRTEEWLARNQDILMSVADGLRGLGKFSEMAEKVGKVIRPIFWLITIGGACWAWGKHLVSSAFAAITHVAK